jgi:hypothetical protein
MEGFMRAIRAAMLLLFGLAAVSAFAQETYEVFEVTGTVTGVASGTPVKIEASGTCCLKCEKRCRAACDGTACTDQRCCAATTDIDRVDARGNFALFVEAGDYHLIMLDAKGNQWLLVDRFKVAGNVKLPTRDVKAAKLFRPAPAQD